MCRALYHQLVKETIFDPHAKEESDSGEVVDHVSHYTPSLVCNLLYVLYSMCMF